MKLQTKYSTGHGTTEQKYIRTEEISSRRAAAPEGPEDMRRIVRLGVAASLSMTSIRNAPDSSNAAAAAAAAGTADSP